MLRMRTSLLLVIQVLLTSTVQSPVGGRVAREEGGQQLAGIPGRPGNDYPTLWKVPKTSFSCVGRSEGFYADEEARCQVFHVCGSSSGSSPQQSFLCPNGTLFNVQVKTCDWWNNVECNSNPSEEEEQPLTSGEEGRPVKLSNQGSETSGKNLNDGFYHLPKISTENEVRINFNRSKFLLDALSTKVKPDKRYRNSSSKTITIEVDEEPLSGSGDFDKEDFEKNVRRDKEVAIKPRIKYYHSVTTSTTKKPIVSVTTYLEPTGSSFEGFEDLSEQNKYSHFPKSNERHRIHGFLGGGEDTETEFAPHNKGREVERHSDISKSINKLNQNKNYSEKVSQEIKKFGEEQIILPSDDLYSEKKKKLNVPERYTVQKSTNGTQVNSKLKSYSSVQEVDNTSAAIQIHRERKDFKTNDRKITMHRVSNDFRPALDESILIKRLLGSVGEKELLPLLINATNQENPDNLYWLAENYTNRYLHDKRDQKYKFPVLDTLKSTERVHNFQNKSKSHPNSDDSSILSNKSFVFDKYGDRQKFLNSDNLLRFDVSDDLKEGINKLKNVGTQNHFKEAKMLNKEPEEFYSISKQNFTYEEHIESLPKNHKTYIQQESPRNTKISYNSSYVSVPNFSSFPELYTSSLSGYYITELPPVTKQLAPNLVQNPDYKVKSRSTRLDGESYNSVGSTEKSSETDSDLLQSETESMYATPKSTSTVYEETGSYNQNFNANFNNPVTEETLLQDTTKLLPSENKQKSNFENEAFLGPGISFENSHIAWPIFPPRSIFYSPYPDLKHWNSPLGVSETLTFFPHPPRRNRVNKTNNDRRLYNHDQEPGQTTEKYASTTPKFDISQVLQEFLSNSPDEVNNRYSDTQSSSILVQPTVEVYSESSTSVPTEDTFLKSEPAFSPVVAPIILNRTNHTAKVSTLHQTTENFPLFGENSYDNFRDEFLNEDFREVHQTPSMAPSDQFNIDFKNIEDSKNVNPLVTTLANSTLPSDQRQNLQKTVLEPPDVLNINRLQASSKTTTEESLKYPEIVKSLSFDLDSPEGREQFEDAQSKGLFER